MQEMVENVSYFTIRPPEKSSYRLIIYAKDLDQQVCSVVCVVLQVMCWWAFDCCCNDVYLHCTITVIFCCHDVVWMPCVACQSK